MLKCHFCTKSDPNGKCHWELQKHRESDCRNAIKLMTEAFKYQNICNEKLLQINQDTLKDACIL